MHDQSMLTFYLSLLLEIPRLLVEGHGSALGWLLLVAFVLSLLSPGLAKRARHGVRTLSGDEPWTKRGKRLAALFLALFLVWGLMKANYRRVVEIEQHADSLAAENADWAKRLRPLLKIDVTQPAVVRQGADGLEVLLPIVVTNQGAAGSVIRWDFKYTSPTLDSMVMPLQLPGDSYLTKDDHGRRIAFKQSEFIMAKAVSPIPQNGVVTGRQLIELPARCLEEFQNGTALITVSIYDVYGRRSESRFGAGRTGRFLLFPGESIGVR